MFCFNYCLIVYLFSITYSLTTTSAEEFCSSDQLCGESGGERSVDRYVKSFHSNRYLIYDQNFGEGFNLRRDIYIRMALMVRQLGADWSLVLPKWSLVPHWRQRANESTTDWSNYFDVKSLNRFVSVIEFNDFVHQFSDGTEEQIPIDVLLSLDHFEDTFESNEWSERHSMSDCNQTKHFKTIDNKIINLYENNNQFYYKRLVCLKIEGFVSTLREIIHKTFAESNTVFISNAEIVLNNEFGSQTYWSVRRSMRFSEQLISIANSFRKQYLNSDDISDKTVLERDWLSMKRTHGQAVGGPYLSVHLRRTDFAKWRTKDVPNIECALKQIGFILNTFIETNYVFIASDANPEEWDVINKYFNETDIKVFRFTSTQLSDGQLAIVEQWIAVHAMLFVGTYDSTFSFRIQEEREILGFSPNTTFNAFCAKCDKLLKLCKQESEWKIIY